MDLMKEEEESDIELVEELPEETPQIKEEKDDEAFREVEVDEEANENIITKFGARSALKVPGYAINTNTGATSSNIVNSDPSTAAIIVETDEPDPLIILHIEQLSGAEDVQVGCVIRDIYNVFYMRYVGGNPDSVQKFLSQRTNRRPDLDGEFPFYGVDEVGNYADPPSEEELINWAGLNWKRRSPGYIWPAYRGALFYKKIIQIHPVLLGKWNRT